MSPGRPAPTDSTRQSSDWTASETDDGDGEQTDLTSCSAMGPEQEDMFEDSEGEDGEENFVREIGDWEDGIPLGRCVQESPLQVAHLIPDRFFELHEVFVRRVVASAAG